jgi:hypothetical protein
VTRKPKPILLGADAPRVLTVPMISAVLSAGGSKVARNTIFNWMHDQREAGTLRPVTRGLYLNQLALPRPEAAEAASYVRSGAIVSLQTVLGDAGVLNNYSDVVTCVLPLERGLSPSTRTVRANRLEYRFHVMPGRLLDDRAGDPEDRFDPEVTYPRATSEKALLDWIYLGASHRSKIAGPSLDTDMARLDILRLERLASAMQIESDLKTFLERKSRFDADPSVIANDAVDP